MFLDRIKKVKLTTAFSSHKSLGALETKAAISHWLKRDRGVAMLRGSSEGSPRCAFRLDVF